MVDRYDLVIFDLDGVLCLGDQPVLGAPEAVTKLRGRPLTVIFATNNASRLPEAVADLLSAIGIAASRDEVLTSSRAAAQRLAQRYPAGSPILVVGAPALAEEVRRVGLRPVAAAGDDPVAVVQGYGPNVGWAGLAEATVAVRAGAAWVATNADRTLPSPRGPLPGNGSLVAALATALDRQPDTIVGKPDPELFRQAVAAVGASRPLVVGDRLDTDIDGANRAGLPSLLVLTGVSRPADVLAAPPERRPTFIAWDLSGLFADAVRLTPDAAAPAPDVARLTSEGEPQSGGAATGWRVRADGTGLVLSGAGESLDALRVLCATHWRGVTEPNGATDSNGSTRSNGGGRGTAPSGATGLPVIAGDGRAAGAALVELGLA